MAESVCSVESQVLVPQCLEAVLVVRFVVVAAYVLKLLSIFLEKSNTLEKAWVFVGRSMPAEPALSQTEEVAHKLLPVAVVLDVEVEALIFFEQASVAHKVWLIAAHLLR